jgi:hypothetical protein
METQHPAEASLQGNIAVIELNTVFQFFDYAALSGELRVVVDHNSASFFFDRGILIFGSLSTNPKRIGTLLLESGLVTGPQLAQCLQIHAREGRQRRVGDILVRHGYLSRDNLTALLKKQGKEAFFETLAWKKGMFYFYPQLSPGRGEVLFSERVDHLLLEGIVRLDDEAAGR